MPAEPRPQGRGGGVGRGGVGHVSVEQGGATRLESGPIPGSAPDSEAAVSERFLRAGVSRQTLAEIGGFLEHENVGFDGLSRIVEAGQYEGVELEQALAAYAIVIAACSNQHVSPTRATGLRRYFLGAIDEGQVRFEVVDPREMSSSAPRYRHADNTIGVPRPGIDLSTIHARGLLVHEAQHVVQDARRETNTLYVFERDGHDTMADYVLRAAGALRCEHGISTFDLNRAYATIDVPHQAAIARRGTAWDSVDRFCLEAMVSAHVVDALERDRLDLLRPRIDAESARRLVGEYTVEAFQELCLTSQMDNPTNAGCSREAIDAAYRTPITRSGLG